MDKSIVVWEFDQSICSCVKEAAALVKELIGHLKTNDWNEKDTFAVFMATEEALMNAVKHGNEHDKAKSVKIKILLKNNSFYAKVSDEGDGFDPEQVPDPCSDSNIDKTSGRGVALIKSFVDEVVYNECGNSVEFWKSRTN